MSACSVQHSFKNKHESQRIQKRNKNRHRRPAWHTHLEPTERGKFTKPRRSSRRLPADLDHVIRACRGVSVRDVIDVITFQTEATHQVEEQVSDVVKDETPFVDRIGDDVLDWEWSCQACTFINWPDALQCEICGHLNQHTLRAMDVESQEVRRDVCSYPFIAVETENLGPNVQRTAVVAVLTVDYLDTSRTRTRIGSSQRNSSQSDSNEMKKKKRGRMAARKAFSLWKTHRRDRRSSQQPLLNKRKLEKRLYPSTVRSSMWSSTAFNSFFGYAIHPMPVPERLQSVAKNLTPGSFSIAFHGTNTANLSSISQKGLLVGGRGCARAHGAAYGSGVYCSPVGSMAQSYGSGCVFACAVLRKRMYGDIWVAPTAKDILPCFVMTKSDDISRFQYLQMVNPRWYRTLDRDGKMVAAESKRSLYESIYGAEWIRNGGFGVPKGKSKAFVSMSYEEVMSQPPCGRLNDMDLNRRKRRIWV